MIDFLDEKKVSESPSKKRKPKVKKPLHKRASTTRKIRRLIQNSSASNPALARQWGVNVKTIAKWKARQTVEDAPIGQKRHGRLALTPLNEAILLFFRKGGQLPLDDCFRALQVLMPALTRSNLYRSLKRHNVHQLYQKPPSSPKKKPSETTGRVYGTILWVKTQDADLCVRLAMERRSKYVHVEFRRGMPHTQEDTGFLTPLPFPLRDFEEDNAGKKRPLAYPQAAWMFEDFFLAFVLNYNQQTPLKALKGKTPLQKLQEASSLISP